MGVSIVGVATVSVNVNGHVISDGGREGGGTLNVVIALTK